MIFYCFTVFQPLKKCFWFYLTNNFLDICLKYLWTNSVKSLHLQTGTKSRMVKCWKNYYGTCGVRRTLASRIRYKVPVLYICTIRHFVNGEPETVHVILLISKISFPYLAALSIKLKSECSCDTRNPPTNPYSNSRYATYVRMYSCTVTTQANCPLNTPLPKD